MYGADAEMLMWAPRSAFSLPVIRFPISEVSPGMNAGLRGVWSSERGSRYGVVYLPLSTRVFVAVYLSPHNPPLNSNKMKPAFGLRGDKVTIGHISAKADCAASMVD